MTTLTRQSGKAVRLLSLNLPVRPNHECWQTAQLEEASLHVHTTQSDSSTALAAKVGSSSRRFLLQSDEGLADTLEELVEKRCRELFAVPLQKHTGEQHL